MSFTATLETLLVVLGASKVSFYYRRPSEVDRIGAKPSLSERIDSCQSVVRDHVAKPYPKYPQEGFFGYL